MFHDVVTVAAVERVVVVVVVVRVLASFLVL